MSILNEVKTGKAIGPLRAIIYSEPKIGKTTLMASVPDVVFIPMEDGQGTLDITRLPRPEDWASLMQTLEVLATEKHPYKAVAIDTLSGVEQLAWSKVCDESMNDNWEKFHAFGRGPRQASALFVDLCLALDAIRRKGIAIFCSAHSKQETVDDVVAGSYTRISPALDKHALAVVERWSDLIGHIEIEKFATDKGSKEQHAKKTRTAQSTGVRNLIVEDTGSHKAGNRFRLASPIELPEENPYGALRAALREAVKPTTKKEAA